MMIFINIIISVAVGILLYNILILGIRHSRHNSPWRHLGEALFASMSRFYDRVSAGTQKIYTTFANKGLNNLLGLFGTIVCTIAMFLLVIIDISFISLMGAQFWGSDPELLANEISEAVKTVVPIDSLSSYFDSLINWAVSHVTTNPSGHFLASNALITVICLLISGLFLKECCKPSGWLPLNLEKTGRWVVGSLSTLLLLCVIFYYGFLIYYGVSSTIAVGSESTEIVNYFEEKNSNVDSVINNPLDSLNGGKLAASVSYAIAVLGVNFLAFWGALLFYGMIITLLLILFRWVLETGYDYIILPLGVSLGYVQIQTQSQNLPANQIQSTQSIQQPGNMQNVESEMTNEATTEESLIETAINNNPIHEDDELQQLREEIEERRIAEEDRQRKIYNDPLNLN